MRDHPSAFLKFSRQFYDNVFEHHPTKEGPVLFALQGLTLAETEALLMFVDAILNDGKTDRELAGIWASSHADIWVEEPSIRLFLETVKATLAERRSARLQARHGRT